MAFGCALAVSVAREFSVQPDQQPRELTARWTSTDNPRERGKVGEPVGVPRGPVRIIPVRDCVDNMVCLGHLVQEFSKLSHRVVRALCHADTIRPFAGYGRKRPRIAACRGLAVLSRDIGDSRTLVKG